MSYTKDLCEALKIQKTKQLDEYIKKKRSVKKTAAHTVDPDH